MRGSFLTLLVASGMASSAIAQDATPPATAPAPSVPAKERKICRSEPVVGSIMNRRICHTQAEWAAIARADQGNVDQVRNRVDTGGAVGGR